MTLFFYLICGHALADYSLQTDFIAKGRIDILLFLEFLGITLCLLMLSFMEEL